MTTLPRHRNLPRWLLRWAERPDEPVTLDDVHTELTDIEHANGAAAEDITTYLSSMDETLTEIRDLLATLVDQGKD